MTIQELLEQLKQAQVKLDQAGIEDDARFDLDDLIIQTKRAIIKHAVDPLRDISNMTVIDVSQLRALTAQLAGDIQDEQKRTALIGKIISIAKGGLRAVGLPIPF
jgi:hypothetical protein